MGVMMNDSRLDAADDHLATHKEIGNELFKKSDYREAIAEYMEALKLYPDTGKQSKGLTENKERVSQLAAVYRNLSAAHLKLSQWEDAVKAADKSLDLVPGDTKALFRRCQAYEALDRLNEAVRDGKLLIELEPRNAQFMGLMSRLATKAQELSKEQSSTSNRVKQMMDHLKGFPDLPADKQDSIVHNLLVLGRESAGAEMIIQHGALNTFHGFIKSKNTRPSVRLGLIRIISELARDSESRSKKILRTMGIGFFLSAFQLSGTIGSGSEPFTVTQGNKPGKQDPEEEQLSAIQFSIQMLINSLSGYNPLEAQKKACPELVKSNQQDLDGIIMTLIKTVNSRVITGRARDAILELLTKNVSFEALNYGLLVVDQGGISPLMDVASELDDIRHESSMEITRSTRSHVAACLERVCSSLDSDPQRDKYHDAIKEYINDKLRGQDIESKVRAVAAIIALLQGPLEVGNLVLGQQGVVEMMLVMAGSSASFAEQKIAAEAIIAAATKKDKCTSIIRMGSGILGRLVKSSNDQIKIRALVGLCKLGSTGGGDASLKPLGEGSTQKLSAACRKYLINPAKDHDLRRWAIEGLAYLTLDAEVKEELVHDPVALKAMIELAQSGDHSAMYGVITTLVNLTNSHDKQEIIPEMIELAKFSKVHIPEEHEKDKPEFIDKRIDLLVEAGVTAALVALQKSESKTSRELICRVMNAICANDRHRGAVVQQGGAKALLAMALENYTDKGHVQAAQALARLGITIDPTVAFPGQRSCEVVRPIRSLLIPDCAALQNFEALMALTNLAQMGGPVRRRILQDSGFSAIEQYMYEEHQMLRRAAVQCVCNLVTDEGVMKAFEGPNDRVKFLVILLEEDDLETVKAAAGALAMLTSHSKTACEKVFTATRWFECLMPLVSSADRDLQHRAVFVVRNLIAADEKWAEKVIATQLFDVLSAIIRPEVDDIPERIKQIAQSALDKAKEFNLIRPVTQTDLSELARLAEEAEE